METYGPYLEINLRNLEKNFNTLKTKLLPSTTIIPVIKSNGYGSDGIIIAKKLIGLGVGWSLYSPLSLRVALGA